MSVELTVAAKNPLAKLVLDKRDTLASMLGSRVDPGPFITSAIAEVNQLSEPCTAPSVMVGILNAAGMGLTFGKTKGLAYLVPFRNKRNNCTEAQLVVGYKGFLDLGYRSNFLASVHCDVVCKGEAFEMWTDERGPHFKHPVPAVGRNLSAPNIDAAYCQWTTRSGTHGFKIIDRAMIDKAKKNTDPWKFAYDEMAMKTAIRRASKTWSQTPELALAARLDEEAERDEPQAAETPVPPALLELAETRDDSFLDVE